MIVDAGDALLARTSPPPAPGDLNKAESIMRAQGLIGLDAMAVGELEVAVGLARLALLQRQTSQTLLCANLIDRRGRSPFAPRRLVETGGVKVGITAVLELPASDKAGADLLRKANLRLKDAVAVARQQVHALRSAGAEVVLLLAHVGMDRAKVIAREVPGIQLVIVAHSGQLHSLPIKEGETYLVESGRRGQDLGHVQFRLGPGWTADQPLADDSPRQVLYAEASQELALLAKHPSNRSATNRDDPRLARAKALADRLRGTSRPPGDHFIIAQLVTLDDRFADHAGIKGLMNANRASWRVAHPPSRDPRPGPRMRPMFRRQTKKIRIEQRGGAGGM